METGVHSIDTINVGSFSNNIASLDWDNDGDGPCGGNQRKYQCLNDGLVFAVTTRSGLMMQMWHCHDLIMMVM